MEDQIAQFRPMVEKAAHVHWNRIRGRTWLSLDDLIQAGYIGLVTGLRRYDPSLSYDEKGIEAFLWLTIYHTIQKEISRNNHTLYVGLKFKRQASFMRKGGEKTVSEWAKELGVRESTVKEMQDYLDAIYQSMDYAYNDETGDGITLHQLLPSAECQIAEFHEAMEAWEWIDSACRSDLDLAIVRLKAMGYNNAEIVRMIGSHERMDITSPDKKVSAIIHRIRKRMFKEA